MNYQNMCLIEVQRTSNSVATSSVIKVDDMTFRGLEPSTPIVPDGTYRLVLSHSPRFSSKDPYNKVLSCNVPLVLGVPNHSGIRIHVGNTPSDTDGCLLIGLRGDATRILDSRKAYLNFCSRLNYIMHDNPNVFFVIKFSTND